ncbi:MAG: acyl carrier protein [Rhizomicrobium sp.]
MPDKSVESQVIALLKTSFPGARQPITRDSDFVVDLDADSMAMVSLIFAIDEEFGIGTDQLGALVVDCRTVGDLVSAVERLRHERAA